MDIIVVGGLEKRVEESLGAGLMVVVIDVVVPKLSKELNNPEMLLMIPACVISMGKAMEKMKINNRYFRFNFFMWNFFGGGMCDCARPIQLS